MKYFVARWRCADKLARYKIPAWVRRMTEAKLAERSVSLTLKTRHALWSATSDE